MAFEISKYTVDMRILHTLFEAIKAASTTLTETRLKMVLIGHTATEIRLYSFDTINSEVRVSINREFIELHESLEYLGCAMQDCATFLELMINEIESMAYLFI
jgi:hypothetical protein